MKIVSDIRFIPVKRKGSLVGYVSFLYKDSLAIKDVAIHQHLDKSKYRLVYPYNEKAARSIIFPVNRAAQQEIDKEINQFLAGQKIDDMPTLLDKNGNC